MRWNNTEYEFILIEYNHKTILLRILDIPSTLRKSEPNRDDPGWSFYGFVFAGCTTTFSETYPTFFKLFSRLARFTVPICLDNWASFPQEIIILIYIKHKIINCILQVQV